MNKKKKRVIVAAIAAVILFLYAWGFALKTDKYRIRSKKINNGLKIVFISDLHNCFYGGKDQSKLMDEIDDSDPDIVIFGGDIIDEYGGVKNALKLMRLAVKKYPCFYSPGNHELSRSDRKEFFNEVSSLGVHVLSGDYGELEIRGQAVRVYGIYDAKYCGQLENCFDTLDDKYYNILLNHQPDQYEMLTESGDTKFDLILSGHAHGGQWRIPKLLDQGLYAPDQGLFPNRTNGKFEYGESVQIVSRGLARPLRMIFIPRIFNRPELCVIEVEPS